MNHRIISSKHGIFKLLNLFLRVLPLAVKFLFFTVLSKVMDADSYGSYTLITTTITVSIFILGLDFYNYSIREVLLFKQQVFQKIFTTFFLYLATYTIISLFILAYLLTYHEVHGEFSRVLIIIIALICFSEHLCQEAYRIQIAFKRILLANLIFFFRLFFWMAYLSAEIILYSRPFNLYHILNIWLIFNLISIGLNFLVAIKPILRNFNNLSLNIDFIKNGLIVSSMFFAGTISLKTIEYLNRYIVDIFLGKEITGVFSFYSNLALVISVYINAIVVSFELPALIEKGNDKSLNQYFQNFKKVFLKQISVIVIILLIAIVPILIWQNKPIYKEYLYVFFILLISSVIINYSLVYHFYLYVIKKDKTILLLTIKSGVFNILSTVILTYLFGILGTCIAFLMTSICLIYLRKSSSKKNGYD